MPGRLRFLVTFLLCLCVVPGWSLAQERQSGAPKPVVPKPAEKKAPEAKKPESKPKKEPVKAAKPGEKPPKTKPTKEEREKELAHEGPLLHFFEIVDGKCAWVIRNIGTETDLVWHETKTCPEIVLWDPKDRHSTYNQGVDLFRVAWPLLPLPPEEALEVEEPPGGGAPEPGAEPKPAAKPEDKTVAGKKPETAVKPPPESGDAGDTGGEGEKKAYELPEPAPAGKLPAFYAKRPGEIYLWIDYRSSRLRMAVTNAPDGPPVERKVNKIEEVVEKKDGAEVIVLKEVEQTAWSFPYRGKMIDAPPKDETEGAPERAPTIVVVRELRGEKWLSVERAGIWYGAGDGPPGQYTKSFQRRRGTILSLGGFLRSSSWLAGIYALRKERFEEAARGAFRAAFTARAGELPKDSVDLSLVPLRRGALALPVSGGKAEGDLRGIAPVYFARRDGSRIGAKLMLQKFAGPKLARRKPDPEKPDPAKASKPPTVLRKVEKTGEVQVVLPKAARKPAPKPVEAPPPPGLNIARAGNYVLIAAGGTGNNAAVFKIGEPKPVFARPAARAAIWIYFSDFWRTVPPREPKDIRKRKKKAAAKKVEARPADKRRPVMTCDAQGCRPVRGTPAK